MIGSYALSALDEARFGVRSARAVVSSVEELGGLEEKCKADRVQFLITRTPTGAVDVVQEMEGRGFFLTDTLLSFGRDLHTRPVPKSTGEFVVRGASDMDANRIREVAAVSFAGYLGHYHADPYLAKRDCDEVYSDWAYRGCRDHEIADYVLVAEQGAVVVGFCLVKFRSPEVGQGTLYGVHPDARGQGAYRELVIAAMDLVRNRGRNQMIESTQVTNLVSQKVWVRLGFEPRDSYYTLHKWFDRPKYQ